MAERRMFAKTIIDSDAFLDMPMSARLLYYDLSMRADDDGFINSPKKIMRMIGATQDDLSILAARKFIIPFDNGIVVIKHWYIHNYIRKDTYNETPYKEQRDLLEFDENKSYRLRSDLNEVRQLSVDEPSTQVRLGKDSIGKDNNICQEVIDYLNQVLGTHYTTKNKTNMSHIRARYDEGHPFEDFKTVIDKKCGQWKNDPKMSTYLRPETLFCSKHFESYLNEIIDVKPDRANIPSVKPNSLTVIPKATHDKIHNYFERNVDYAALEAEVFNSG